MNQLMPRGHNHNGIEMRQVVRAQPVLSAFVTGPRAEGRGPNRRKLYHAQALALGAGRSALPVWLAVLILALVSGLMPKPAAAHRLQVFAAAAGDVIEGSAYFAGGAPAVGVRVRIESADGRVLAEIAPAADGSFSYHAKAPVDHRVVVRSADGHRAQWLVGALELAPAFGEAGDMNLSAAGASGESGIASVTATDLAVKGPAADSAPELGPAMHETAKLDSALIAALERAVARQVRPLREELAASDARAGLRDVLGGIGYIVGLAGLALWWRCRGSGPRQPR